MLKNEVKANLLEFMLGGHADFCIVQDGENYGNGLQAKEVRYRYVIKKGKSKSVYLLFAGEVSNSSTKYLGTLRVFDDRKFSFTSAKELDNVGMYWLTGLKFVFDRLDNLPRRVHIVHNGKCAKCGRLLTDGESVVRGFGPSCAKKLGI